MGALCAQDMELSSYDVGSIGEPITRETVAEWLSTHSGDFSEVIDFEASIETRDGETVNVPWSSDENEMQYLDCMFPPEAEEASHA